MGFAVSVADRLKGRGKSMGVGEVHNNVHAEFKDPDLLRIYGSYSDPATAVLLANVACQTLDAKAQQELRTQMQGQVDSLTRLTNEANVQVEKNMKTLADYAKSHGVLNLSLDTEASQYSQMLNLINGQQMELAQQHAALQEDQRNLQTLETPEGARSDALHFPIPEPSIATLRQQIEDTRSKLWDAKKAYTDNHPVVKDLTQQLIMLQNELDQKVRALKKQATFHPSAEWQVDIASQVANTKERIISDQAQIDAWNHLIAQQQHDLGVAPETASEISRLKTILGFAQTRYTTLAAKLDDARVAMEGTKGNLSIIQPAAFTEPLNMLIAVVLVFGVLVGMPLGLGLFVDYLSDSIGSPVRFATELGEVCLAALPRSSMLSARNMKDARAVPCLDEIRVMRSSMALLSGPQAAKKIGILSGHTGEGTSTVVLQLARALVDAHKRVTIVDADLRTTGVAAKFGIRPKVGLLQVLFGERELDDALISIDDSIQLLPGRPFGQKAPANAELLFAQERFAQCLAELSLRNDTVLIDMPPLLEFPDSVELLQHLDAVALVVNGGNQTRAEETARRCLDLLERGGARRLGIIVNRVEV